MLLASFPERMDVGTDVVKPLKDFAKNSIRLVKRCTKPDRKGKWTRQVSQVAGHTHSTDACRRPFR